MSEQTSIPRIEYDREADAAYVYLNTAAWDHMEIIDDFRNVDYAADDQPIGVELLYVSKGVNLDGLPQPDVLAALLATEQIPIFA